jgi:hypothetical protein
VQDEVDYYLGGSFEHITRPSRNSSYIATIALDLAAALELSDVYDDVRNDFLAVGAFPFVPLPQDDPDQYKVGGNVPIDTAPKYAEDWTRGDEWRMAPHHTQTTEQFYLGRIGRPWDQLAVSAVTRDRHWVSAIRVLAETQTAA